VRIKMATVMKASELDRTAGARIAALELRELAAQVSDAVLDARRQAARVIAEAREEARALALQAEERGYADGFERGLKEGQALGERRAYEETRLAIGPAGAGQSGGQAGRAEDRPGSYNSVGDEGDVVEELSQSQ